LVRHGRKRICLKGKNCAGQRKGSRPPTETDWVLSPLKKRSIAAGGEEGSSKRRKKGEGRS